MAPLSTHTLKHSFASQLVMNGCDIYTLKELMRHSKIEMTERYAHLSPNHKSKAINILCGVIGQKDKLEMQDGQNMVKNGKTVEMANYR